MGLIGIVVLLGICWLFSSARKAVNIRTLLWGVGLQFVLAVLVLGIPALNVPGVLHPFFAFLSEAFLALLVFSQEGIGFVFGSLADQEKSGFIFLIQALMPIPFIAALMGVLTHWGILQKIVYAMGWVMQRTMRTSGSESLAAAANVFLGQTEAPLLVRPYVGGMTRSELLCLMVGGFTTIAGSVLIAYISILQHIVPDIAMHLLTASVMSAPAALVAAKLLIPETEETATSSKTKLSETVSSKNAIDAAAQGASRGLYLALNVAAMLLAFVALIAMLNGMLAKVGDWIAFAQWGAVLLPEGAVVQLNLQNISGLLCAPIAWLIGIPWSEAHVAGAMIGEKVALNEFVAYLHLAEAKETLSERSATILSYALCGFANFSSIGILIGGIGSLAPERKHDLAQLGLRALLGGTIASLLTGAVVSLLL